MPRPRRRLPSPRFWFWLCIGALVVLRVLTLSRADGQRDFRVEPLREGFCRVVRVLSGNQLLVVQDERQGEVVVHLLSTQAPLPEDEPALVDAARRFTESFVARGEVSLMLDNHRLDSAGRYLAYVECGDQQLNEALLSTGLARFFYFPGNSASMDRRLKHAEAAAREAKLGVWASP
jgi:endonuclease YncB( thermonuclease family)